MKKPTSPRKHFKDWSTKVFCLFKRTHYFPFISKTQFTVGKLPENGLQEIIDLNRETFVQLRENILGVKEHRRLGKIFLLVYIFFSAIYLFFNIISMLLGFYKDYISNLFLGMYTVPQGRISGISSLNLEDGEKLRRDGILLSQRHTFY